MIIDKTKLRELAEAATRGEWFVSAYDTTEKSASVVVRSSKSPYAICGQKSNRKNSQEGQRRADLTYIAHADPQTVIALLDELQAITTERDELKNKLHDEWMVPSTSELPFPPEVYKRRIASLTAECDELKHDIERHVKIAADLVTELDELKRLANKLISKLDIGSVSAIFAAQMALRKAVEGT